MSVQYTPLGHSVASFMERVWLVVAVWAGWVRGGVDVLKYYPVVDVGFANVEGTLGGSLEAAGLLSRPP